MEPNHFSKLADTLEAPIISDLMAQAIQNPDLLSIAAGFTDNVLLPNELLQEQAVALLKESTGNEVLQYGTTQGRERLREEILKHLHTFPDEQWELPIDQVLVSNGSQQSLYLAMQVLCDPGDIILVEDPTYFVFLEMLKGLQIEAIGMPSDHCGRTDIDKTDQLFKQLKAEGRWEKVKGIYLVSYYSNPTSRCLSKQEKSSLLDLLQYHQFSAPIVEDAAYRDLYYDQPAEAPTLLSSIWGHHFNVLYTGTFTKPLATGLKVGFAVSNDKKLLDKMVYAKGHHDFGSAHFNQALVERILVKGLYPELLQKQRKHYQRKAQVMTAALERSGIQEMEWHWEIPSGGLLLWLIDRNGKVNTDMGSEFCKSCLDNGVLYVPGSLCFASRTPNCAMRLSFGTLPDDKLDIAIDRLCENIKKYSH